jgi:NitT/TauT family transport system substrate-binding protein
MKKIIFVLLSFFIVSAQSFTIGMVEWLGYAGNNVADVKGYWKNSGLDVTVKVYSNSQNLKNAFNKGEVDIMHNVLATSLDYYFEGKDIVVVMETGWSYGGDKLIIKRGKSVKNLKGTDIGVYSRDPGVLYFVDKSLNKKSLALSDFSYEVFDPEMLTAKFADGTYDVVVNYDPEALQTLKKGQGEILTSSKDFSGIIPEGWIMMRSKYNSTNKKDLTKLMEGWIKAVKWINKKKNFKEFFRIVKKKTFISKSMGFRDVKTTLNGIKYLRKSELKSENKKKVYEYFKDLRKFLKKNDMLKKPYNPKYLVDTSILLKAL